MIAHLHAPITGDCNWGDRVLVDATPIHGEHVDCRRPMTARDLSVFDGVLIGPGGLITIDSIHGSMSGWQWNIATSELRKINAPIASIALGWNLFKGQKISEQARASLRVLGKKSLLTFRHSHDRDVFESNIGCSAELCFCPSIVVGEYRERTGGAVAINVAFDRQESRFGSHGHGPLMNLIDAFPDAKIVTHMNTDIAPVEGLGREIVNLSTMSTREGLGVYSEFEYVIAFRGHGQMIPYGLGCKIIGVETHDKIAAFGADTNTPVIQYDDSIVASCQNAIENYSMDFDRHGAVTKNIKSMTGEIKGHLKC